MPEDVRSPLSVRFFPPLKQLNKKTERKAAADHFFFLFLVEDGKFLGDSDAGEFWTFFGGYAPIPKCSSSTSQEQTTTTCAKLLW